VAGKRLDQDALTAWVCDAFNLERDALTIYVRSMDHLPIDEGEDGVTIFFFKPGEESNDEDEIEDPFAE
jgi:hypothetical protein